MAQKDSESDSVADVSFSPQMESSLSPPSEYSYENSDTVSEQQADTVEQGCIFGVMLFLITIFLLGLLAVYSIMIYLGSEHHCDNHDLKIWMIVYGSASIVSMCLGMCGNKKNIDQTYKLFIHLVSLFLLAWLIVGTVWFFSYDVGPNYSYCDELMYKYGKNMIITSWILYGICTISLIVIMAMY